MDDFNSAANAEVTAPATAPTENQGASESLATSQTVESNNSNANTNTQSTQPTENNVTDITTTQAFSNRLKESTQKAIDAEYSRLYGEEYGIHTKADYEAAVVKQRQAEEAQKLGIDPDAIKPFFEQWKQSDPDFQELNTIRQANNVSKALNELNSELKDMGLDLNLTDLSDSEVAKLPNVDKVTEYVSKGHSLADAVFLANKKEFITKQAEKAHQDTIKKISANAASSPGSLSGGIDNNVHITQEMFNANKGDPKWVQANYSKIQSSRSKW